MSTIKMLANVKIKRYPHSRFKRRECVYPEASEAVAAAKTRPASNDCGQPLEAQEACNQQQCPGSLDGDASCPEFQNWLDKYLHKGKSSFQCMDMFEYYIYLFSSWRSRA